MTKLTRELARKQAARLQACALLAPQSDDGRAEVVDCLMRNCQSAEHAAAAMTQLLDNAQRVQNLTAELAAAARETQTAETAPAGCDRCCEGPDLNTGEMRWASHVLTLRNFVECQARCSCDRGRWLQAKDRGRMAAQPERRKGKLEQVDYRMSAAGERE